MNCYFLSEIPSYLKVDGEYAGVINRNMQKGTFQNKPSLIEFLPCSEDFSPVYFYEKSPLLKQFRTPDGYLYFPRFNPKRNLPFKMVFQRSFSCFSGNLTLTVTEDNGVKFFVDGCFCTVNALPFSPCECAVDFYGEFAVISFKRNKIALFVYRISDGSLAFSDVCDEFSLGEFLTVKKRYLNVTKTTVIENWKLSSPCALVSVTDEKEKDFRFLDGYLLPLAFFENATVGASVKEIVTQNFYQKTESLREFLGKVLRVVISPLNENAVWLIGENGVSSATLSLNNGLIDNLFIDDF